MKKKIFSLLVLLMTAAVGTTRAYEAQIGDGTYAGGDYPPGVPFYTLYKYSLSECLFLASELTAAGVEAGPITSLSWYATNQTGYEQQGLSMWLANVTDEALTGTSHASTGMTLVYTGSMTPVTGWNEFVCNEGTFEWDGTSNLLILFDRNCGAWSSTINWQFSDAGFNAMSYARDDNGAYDPSVPVAMSKTNGLRPNIIIKGEAGVSSGYALTKDADAEAHGDIQFNVGEGENVKEDVTSAKEGDLVTVVITPDEGWVVNEVSGLWYANEAAARGLRRIAASPESLDMLKDFDLQFVSEDPETRAQTYTFEMKRAKAEISVSYKKLLNNADITIENIADQTYTGQAIEPTITVKDGSTVLVQGTDYTITYSNNVNAALKTATENAPTVTITAVATSEKYAGETTKTFTINPAQLSDDMIAPIADKTYTGSGIEPALTITFGEGDNAQTLVKGTDFTVVYSNNTVVGVGTATVTGQGNFTGTASADFNIVAKALNKNMISPIDDLEYTGEPQEPGLDVNYNGNPLVEGTDYTAVYENNTEAGKATVTITGKGNYEGTATANFYIGRKDLNEDDMKVEYIYWEHYNGQKHTPQLTIRDGTKQLIEDKDYKVTFKNNVNAGTANVTVEGLGNYKGTVRKYFAIYSYVLNEDMVQAIADQTWTGEAVTPAVTVINGNMTLTEGKDYTVKFKNNVNEGTATAIINGTGNFRSIDLVKTFKIVKKAEVTEPEAVDSPGEATAISGPAAAGSPAGTAYDLGGRKAKANRKGVVIIDGKLVLKK